MYRLRRLGAALAVVSALAVAASPLLGLPSLWEWAQQLVTSPEVALWAPSGGHSDPNGAPSPPPLPAGDDAATTQSGGHSDPNGG